MKSRAFLYRISCCIGLSCSALYLGSLPLAQGQGLTYVDAAHEDFFNDVITPANLFVAPAGSPDGTGVAIESALNDDGTRVNNNGLWDYNANNGGANPVPGAASTVYTSGDPNNSFDPNLPLYEDAPELGMRVPGLAASTSYDLYVVYWGSPSANWSVRAGLTPNPGANQVFNRTGPTDFAPTAVAGNLATSAIWDTAPPVNGTSGTVFEDDNRRMFLGLVGTGVSSPSGTLDVFFDDLPTFEGDPNDPMNPARDTAVRTWFDGIAYVPTGSSPIVTATIDRTAGTVAIHNSTGSDIDFTDYSISSASGGLKAATWDSISGGNSTVVESDAWNVVAPADTPSATTELSEMEDAAGGGSGARLANGTSFDLGDVWIRNPSEDVTISLTLANGQSLTIGPTYVNGERAMQGDFDFDGDLDRDDYAHLMGNMFVSPVGVTEAESYTFGDLSGDQAIDFDDHSEFQDLFDAANGAGAFQAMIAAVPEPSSLGLLGISILVGTLGGRSKGRHNAV